MKTIVAILAGGRSSRMGTPKPALLLDGRPLIDYPLAAARAAGLEPWVVAKPASALPPLECRVLREPEEPLHPLCGVVATLREAEAAAVVAVAADMPFVNGELLRWLAAAPGTATVESGGRLQPLLARYPAAALGRLEGALAAGESATAVLRSLRPRVLGAGELRRYGEPELLCMNVNAPVDLDRAAATMRALTRRGQGPGAAA